MKPRKTTFEEREQIIATFNSMDDVSDRYAQIGKQFGRSTSTVFNIIKASQKPEPKIKYFNPREPQF